MGFIVLYCTVQYITMLLNTTRHFPTCCTPSPLYIPTFETLNCAICLNNTVQYCLLHYSAVLYFKTQYISYCSIVYCTVLYNTLQYCTLQYGNVPAQNSPWGHFAAEIEFCCQFLCLLSFA